MSQAQTILSQDPQFPEWLNFEYLRLKGREHIGKLSGDLWTDHNIHDPGITILEVLCYALTDLGYRNQFDIEDIFARPLTGKLSNTPDDNFFSPAEMLSVNPLTLRDYQKLLLDMPGVRNAWIVKRENEGQEVKMYYNPSVPAINDKIEEKYTLSFCNQNDKTEELKIRGLYDVYLDIEDNTPQYGINKDASAFAIKAAVEDRLMAHRNLCEDFFIIHIVEKQPIRLCTELELTPEANPEEVIITVFETIQNFLTPTIEFHTLQQMLEKGKTIEDIFDGRPLTKDSFGFIDVADLPNLDPKKEIHLSDIYRLIMNVAGVRAIKHLDIDLLKKINNKCEPEDSVETAWTIPVDITKSPLLKIECSEVLYSKGSLPLAFNTELVKSRLTQRLVNKSKIRRSAYELGFSLPQGTARDFQDYTSIQRDFPIVYGVGEGHIPQSAGKARLRQAYQLKGYLAFFDQILANYLAQLSNVRRLFALRPSEDNVLTSSYFSQVVESMPDADRIIRFIEKKATEEGVLGSDEGFTFYKNQSIAVLKTEKPLVDRHWRNTLIGFFKQAFEADTIELKITDAWEKDPNVEECDRFHYELIMPSLKVAIKSLYRFKTKQEAINHAEIIKYLGTLSESYRIEDDTMTPQYGFSIVYNPLSYKAYLDRIAESPAVFEKRRNAFLNHLLARFAEQFTEYTLLMFALNGKANTQTDINLDKARFLSQYDRLSRNRSKGFNYKDREEVWNTTNTSGFEQRVAGYMGLDDWRRRTLNHFKLVKSEPYWILEWHDPTTKCLIFTAKVAPLEASVKTAIENDTEYFKKLFADKETRCIPIGCEQEGLFGFTIWDDALQVYWEHPPQYPTASERDKALDFWKKYFSEDKWVVETFEEKQGFRFVWINIQDGSIGLKSKDVYPTETAAYAQFWLSIPLAFDEKNYKHQTNAEGKCTFVLIDSNKGDKIIAEHPNAYDSEEESTEAAEKLRAYMAQKYVRFSIQKSDDFIDWQIADVQSKPLIYSLLRFEKTETQQAIASFWAARTAATQENNWRLVFDADKCVYYCQLVQPSSDIRLFLSKNIEDKYYPVARSIANYKTETEAELAFTDIKATFKNAVWLDQCVYQKFEKEIETTDIKGKKFKNTEGAYSIRLYFNNSASPIIKSLKNYKYTSKKGEVQARVAATLAFIKFLSLATDINNFVKKNNDSLSKYTFSLKKQDVDVESDENYTSPEARDKALTNLTTYVKKATDSNGWLNPINTHKGVYSINILDNNGENTLLCGTEFYESEQLMLADLPHFFAAFEPQKKKDDKGQLVDDPETGVVAVDTLFEGGQAIYSFELKTRLTNGELTTLATVPEYFEKKKERDSLYATLKNRRPIPPVNTIISETKYRFRIVGMDCRSILYPIYASTTLYLTVKEAEEAGKQYQYDKNIDKTLKDLLLTQSKVKIIQTKDIPPCFDEGSSKKGDPIPIPLTQAIAYDIAVDEEIDIEVENQEKEKDGFALIKKIGQDTNRYRLRDEDYRLARYYRYFTNQTEQLDALQSFASYWKKADHTFPKLSHIGTGVQGAIKKGNAAYFRFSIGKGSEKINLRTAQLYSSAEEAQEKNRGDKQLLQFVKRMMNYDAYEIVCKILPDEKDKSPNPILPDVLGNEEGWRVQLVDYSPLEPSCENLNPEKIRPVLVIAEVFETEQKARQAMKRLMDLAAHYPIFLHEEKEIQFRLINKKTGNADWVSLKSYLDIASAEKGFNETVRLLDYTPNVLLLDKPFGLVVGEILLESKQDFTFDACRDVDCCGFFSNTPQKVWRFGIESLLNRIFQPDAIVTIPQGMDNDCGYGVQVVDAGYLVATHPHYYDNVAQRAKAYQYLMGMTCCGKKALTLNYLSSNRLEKEIVKALKVTKEKLTIKTVKGSIKITDTIIWHIPVSQTEIIEDAENVTEKVEEKEPVPDISFLYDVFLPWAEHPVFYDSPPPYLVYEIVPILDEDGNATERCHMTDKVVEAQYWLRLLNEDGNEVAISSIFKTEVERKDALNKTILSARQHPIKPIRPIAPDTEVRYQVKIYDEAWVFTQNTEGAKGDYIWQSPSVFYKEETDSKLSLEKKLVATRQNSIGLAQDYISKILNEAVRQCRINLTQADPCGDYSLELVDDNKVIACYPTVFDSPCAAQKGIDRILKAVDTEGFHVIENILLRPKEKFVCPVINIQDTVGEKDKKEKAIAEEDKILLRPDAALIAYWNIPELAKLHMGIDPYSAQVTVVLPAWARRFQKTEFRDFFVNTLRRELPAHCIVKPYWLDPQTLRQFEQLYRAWLTALANDLPEEEDLKKQMAQLLPTLSDFYAPMVLNQANQLAYLDKAKVV